MRRRNTHYQLCLHPSSCSMTSYVQHHLCFASRTLSKNPTLCQSVSWTQQGRRRSGKTEARRQAPPRRDQWVVFIARKITEYTFRTRNRQFSSITHNPNWWTTLLRTIVELSISSASPRRCRVGGRSSARQVHNIFQMTIWKELTQ